MRILVLLAIVLPLGPLTAAVPEHVILCGGPALRQWEDLRVSNEQHDRWWANFIRASTIRLDNLRRDFGPQAKLVWIVYRPGYVTRGREDGKPYPTWIVEQAAKRNCQLIWADSGPAAIAAINSRPAKSIVTFDYFGHSNRYAFMLDYGNEIMAISKAWIHERDLRKISRRVFSRSARCQSFGCHTGESMSQVWLREVGVPLIGAAGKTDYEVVGRGILPTVSGSWVR